MKRITLALMALLSMTCVAKAQQYVSTEPANRNVIIEEFTGRGCQYCPDGHKIANEIMAANPDRVWAINVHAGGYAQTSYPNFITPDGNVIHGGFTISGYPTGVVNRSTAAGQSRSAWPNLTNAQLNQAAVCNVGGAVRINPDTRVAAITVEVYYTGDGAYDENYLTVAMLQDSIMGSQSGMSYNPAQVVNGTYCHMHILRDIIQESAWGEAISPTTQGTLITKTYEYQIPESIGNPNGVEVKIENIFFLAWVSERFQGTPARPILNACELDMATIVDVPIYPSVSNVSQVLEASCSQTKDFEFELSNLGLDAFNSVEFNAVVGESVETFEWTGELMSGDKTKMNFEMEIPFGTHTGVLNITKVNGESYTNSTEFAAECTEWAEKEFDGDLTTLKVYIIQDQFGEQTTWNIINSAGEIVAEGGPYQHLVGQGATQTNVATLNNIPTDDCYLFTIFDTNNNGICCNYGNGYYYIKDANGDKIVEGDGDFGAMAAHSFMLKKRPDAIDENTNSHFTIYPNPANNMIVVEGENVELVEIYNSLGQKVLTVEGSTNTTLNVASFENGVYMVRVISSEGISTKKVSISH
jgi:hypothetical protein